MGLFTTKTKRTYHRTKPKRGWSTTSKASTRLKRWAKRRTKKLWRTTKARIRRRWRTTKARIRRRWKRYQRKHPTRKQQIARTARQFQRHHTNMHAAGGYQVDASGGVSYQPSATGTAASGQTKPPPPDGAISSCRRCNNEVMYSEAHGRWEHPGRGHYECFQPGGYDT